MKKNKKIMLFIILLIFSIPIFAGCAGRATQLSTPTATVVLNNGRLVVTTTDNPNAEGYIFGVYHGPYSNNFDLYSEYESAVYFLDVTSYVSESAIYYFYVVAVGDGEKYLTSGRSSVTSYNHADTLEAPLLERTEYVLSWSGVSSATGYKVFKNNVLIKTFQGTSVTEYDIESHITSSIVYNFEVQAIGGTVGGITLVDSLKSNIVSYTEHLVLGVPQNVSVEINEETQVPYLTWNSVTRASGYTILIDNNTTYTTSGNIFELSSVLTLAKQYSIQVKSNATGVLIESQYSNAYYYDNYLALNTPTILGARRNGSDVLVEWTEVENAQTYTLIVNNEPLRDINSNILVIYDTNIIISGSLEKLEGGFDFEVYANAYDYYLESETSELFNYVGFDELTVPENIVVTYDEQNEKVSVTWDEVEGVSAYLISVDEEVFSTEEEYYEIQELILLNQITAIRVKAVGTGFMIDSVFSDAVLFNYTQIEEEDYTDEYFFYNGYHDYYITSQEELNALFAYNIMIRSNSYFYAYIDYTLTPEEILEADLNANGLSLEEEINYKQQKALDAHTETRQVSAYAPFKVIGNEYRFRLTTPTNVNPNLTSEQINISQYEDLVAFKSQTGRTETYNNFASEQSMIEVPVYNSDQLYMVVTYGAKPIFVEEDSQAEQVYEAAKNVLREIIDDEMSEYEKMLAIFDYVSFNTVYDYYILNLAVNNPNYDGIANFKAFYLEGVLLDGKAVCDGIAKTIALLASMEGIEAVKINGQAGSEESTVSHAWNKVYLEIDGVSNWYMLDATWNDIPASSEEYLSHRYFLLSDTDIEDSHFAESEFNPVANTQFDYYNYTEYEEENNYYIENQAELNDIIDYLLENDCEAVEIKLADTFDEPNFIQAIMLSGETGVTIGGFSIEGGTIYIVDFIYE